jgi:glutathione S-transferase
VFDHLNVTMSKIIVDNIRPAGQRDPYGVEEAKRIVRGVYAVIEAQLRDDGFIVGDSFTLADCSAAPALWYATRNAPLDGAFPRTAAYLQRLNARLSFQRAVKESEPLFHMYPGA